MNTTDGRTVCGPIAHFFPAGATPELKDIDAIRFIDAGVAELCSGFDVNIVTSAEILKDVAVQ